MAGAESGPPFLRTLASAGQRSRELTGAVDLLTHYGLQDLYDHYCAKPLPVSIADSSYLQQVVGDTEIRKGEGMEFQQLSAAAPPGAGVQTLDLQLLQWAFTLNESGPIELKEADKGLETISGNVKDEKDKKQHKKKHKKHKDREKDKDKDKVKKKEKVKDAVKGKEDEKRLKKHRKKKRKYDGAVEEGDGRKHKKKKARHQAELT